MLNILDQLEHIAKVNFMLSVNMKYRKSSSMWLTLFPVDIGDLELFSPL